MPFSQRVIVYEPFRLYHKINKKPVALTGSSLGSITLSGNRDSPIITEKPLLCGLPVT